MWLSFIRLFSCRHQLIVTNTPKTKHGRNLVNSLTKTRPYPNVIKGKVQILVAAPAMFGLPAGEDVQTTFGSPVWKAAVIRNRSTEEDDFIGNEYREPEHEWHYDSDEPALALFCNLTMRVASRDYGYAEMKDMAKQYYRAAGKYGSAGIQDRRGGHTTIVVSLAQCALEVPVEGRCHKKTHTKQRISALTLIIHAH